MYQTCWLFFMAAILRCSTLRTLYFYYGGEFRPGASSEDAPVPTALFGWQLLQWRSKQFPLSCEFRLSSCAVVWGRREMILATDDSVSGSVFCLKRFPSCGAAVALTAPGKRWGRRPIRCGTVTIASPPDSLRTAPLKMISFYFSAL